MLDKVHQRILRWSMNTEAEEEERLELGVESGSALLATFVVVTVADKLVEHVPIVSETRQKFADGVSGSSFEAGNGIKFQQKVVAGDIGQNNAEGAYNYSDEFGNVVQVQYIADENGFQAQGTHLSVAPQAPPRRAQLLKLAEEQRAAGIVFK
ncbi:cuticle protein AMP1A-like [Oratosquilla oratoria]|uniref:cuticle protein AMP1A-like n=1 Tax=Oratosquilla oratoria TaxID=337810 RepID=UPI003F769829